MCPTLEGDWHEADHCQKSAGHPTPQLPAPYGHVCAGQSFPRGLIIGDADGVVVVPLDSAGVVAAAADQRLAREEASRARLKAGELGLDMYGLRDLLTQRGVEWKD